MLGGDVEAERRCRTSRATSSTCTWTFSAPGGSFPRCLLSSRLADCLVMLSSSAARVWIGMLRRFVPFSCMGRGCTASVSLLMAGSVDVMLNDLLTLTAALTGEGLNEGSWMAMPSASEA